MISNNKSQKNTTELMFDWLCNLAGIQIIDQKGVIAK